MLSAISAQDQTLLWQRDAAADVHAENNKALTAGGDGEPNQVEGVITDVLRHHENEDHFDSVPDATVNETHRSIK